MTDENRVTDLRRPPIPPTTPPVEPGDEERSGGWGSLVWETIRYVVIAAAIIIPIRIFIAQPFVVSGNSMYPTFKNGEYLIVDELSKHVGEYRRGDVVILRYPNDPSKYFIKRVVGLPGETVSINGEKTTITGPKHSAPIILDEPYVKNPKQDHLTRTLDNDEYFVMGDNRNQSSDSRIWGPVPARLMDGKAYLRLFPVTRMEYRPGAIEHFHVSY